MANDPAATAGSAAAGAWERPTRTKAAAAAPVLLGRCADDPPASGRGEAGTAADANCSA
jgi:hypothetical protein